MADTYGGLEEGAEGRKIERRVNLVTRRLADKAQSTFATARTGISDGFSAVARAMGRASNQLSEEDQGGLAKQVQRYIGKAESAGQYVREVSPRQLKDDFDRFARERPAVVLGGAFILGLVAARFLKASDRDRPLWRGDGHEQSG